MNTEHFATCIHAYFPTAQIATLVYGEGFGDGQSIWFRGNRMPYRVTITNYLERGVVLLYDHSVSSFAKTMTEEKLLAHLKKLNNAGWTPV